MLGGLLAGAIGYLPAFIWFGYAGTPGAGRVGMLLAAAAWVVPTAVLLPHLWFVGRAVQRSRTRDPSAA